MMFYVPNRLTISKRGLYVKIAFHCGETKSFELLLFYLENVSSRATLVTIAALINGSDTAGE